MVFHRGKCTSSQGWVDMVERCIPETAGPVLSMTGVLNAVNRGNEPGRPDKRLQSSSQELRPICSMGWKETKQCVILE